MTHRDRIELYLREGRTVSGGKGSQTDQTAAHGELDFMKTLQNAFTSQFGNNSSVLNFLRGKLTGMVNNPQGFSPAMLTALNTQATTGTANNFVAANTATNELSAAHGGTGLPSGVAAQITAANANAAAQEQSQAQTGIAVANAQQQNENYWRGVSGLNQVGEEYNPLGYAGATSGAGGTIAGLSEASTAADRTGLGAYFGQGLGQGLGGALAAGGGTLLGKA